MASRNSLNTDIIKATVRFYFVGFLMYLRVLLIPLLFVVSTSSFALDIDIKGLKFEAETPTNAELFSVFPGLRKTDVCSTGGNTYQTFTCANKKELEFQPGEDTFPRGTPECRSYTYGGQKINGIFAHSANGIVRQLDLYFERKVFPKNVERNTYQQYIVRSNDLLKKMKRKFGEPSGEENGVTYWQRADGIQLAWVRVSSFITNPYTNPTPQHFLKVLAFNPAQPSLVDIAAQCKEVTEKQTIDGDM